VTEGSEPSVEGWGQRFWFLLLIPASVLSNPAAIWPNSTYYFRDFLLTFFPLRLFAAREMREGRLPAWNPFIHEGTFHLPSLYPPELLHALAPDPVFISWLLTLHLPLAALAAYWLLRDLGVGRWGAMASGVAYSLGGLALSSLNLYIFLQALALAPFVIGTLRRTADGGSRALVTAAAVLGVALSTMAVEFVAQAALVGGALALVAGRRGRTVFRLGCSVVLGVGLCALPLFVTFGFLPETVRGAGFNSGVTLGNAVHPAVLLQVVVPNLFGLVAAPAEAWWGGRFFTKGFPYFLSLYVGPLGLALALVGARSMVRPRRWVLLGLGALGLWYALGDRGGLAPFLAHVPGMSSFRFPVKAMLLPYLALVVFTGFGVDQLTRERGAWSRLWRGLGAGLLLVLGTVGSVALGGTRLAASSGVVSSVWPRVVDVVIGDGLAAVLVLGTAGLVSLGVARGLLRLPLAAGVLTVLLAADLGRAGAGMNPQTAAAFFHRLPELEGVDREARATGRVFSFGLDHSPEFRRVLARGGPGLGLATFFVHRQVLGPYSNIIDSIETPESTDLTSFVIRPRDLAPEHYDPARVKTLVPWLRNAAVAVVLSLDPLEDSALEPVARVDAGPPGLRIHAYRLREPWPRVYVACRASVASGVEQAMAAPYRLGFDGEREVALDVPVTAACTQGRVSATTRTPREERFVVHLDGPGVLVVRENWARGWKAQVDGIGSPVLRANGRHRAVALTGGQHHVVVRYEPLGLGVGLVAMLVALGVVGVLLSCGSGRATSG
jgi:hypothetical protein